MGHRKCASTRGIGLKSNADKLVKASGRMDKKEELTKEHIWLMQAAVQDVPGAFESWQQWLEKVAIEKEHLDSLSYRLLPLVYYNLAGQHVDHPLLTRLKGIYRRSWLENQLFVQQVIPFLTQLHSRDIPIMLLDDLTSILRLYDGQGVRRPYSLDILVEPQDVPRLVNFLEKSNIWPKVNYGNRFLLVETPLEVWPPFDLPLTIAWRVFPAITTHEQARAAWQAGSPTILGNCPVFTLDLESHFLRSCLRAASASREAAFFARIDVAWMLGKQSDKIDWKRVAELARAYHQVLPVLDSLHEIISLTKITRADELLQQFQGLPISWSDRLDHQFINAYQPYPNFFSRSIRRLLLYRRAPKQHGRLAFHRYLQYAWGANRLRSLPRQAVRHLGGAVNRSRLS
jgi:hypothetical protein